jgi:formylglycine-generating enzyme
MKSIVCSTWFVCGMLVVGCGSSSSTPATDATGGSAANGGASQTSTGGSAATATTSVGGNVAAGGSSSPGGSSGSGCTGGLEEKNANGLCVAKMVSITASTNYKIDVTEVTTGQYQAWVDTKPALPTVSDPVCGWKADPDGTKGTTYAIKADIYSDADADHHPVYQVDWCDAYMYCKGVGKRLCGKIGGGSNDSAGYIDASTDQWYRACSSGGVNKFPYGATYQEKACNGTQQGVHATVIAGSLTTCQSGTTGYAGVFDMSGNIREWRDACMHPATADPAGQEDVCRVGGGDFGSGDKDLGCDFDDQAARYMAGYNSVGIRCCSG